MNKSKLRTKFYDNIVDQVVDQVVDCLGDKDCPIISPPTADQCKQLFYEKWGPTEDRNPIVRVGDYISAAHLDECVPGWLVSSACAYALSLVNWKEIADRVHEESDEHSNQ